MNLAETIFMKESYIKAVRRSYNGGRGIVATILDFICFNALRFLAVYLVLMQSIKALPLRLLLTAIISSILAVISSMLSNHRFSKHEERLRASTEQKLIRRRLLCMKSDILKARAEHILGADCYISQSTAEFDINSLYEAFRSMNHDDPSQFFYIISVSDFSEETKRICDGVFADKIKLKSIDKIPEIISEIYISSNDIDEEIIFEFGKKSAKHYSFKDALKPDRTKKYLLLGLTLFAFSFFVRYSIYMRAASGFVFCIAGACIIINEHKLNRSMRSSERL